MNKVEIRRRLRLALEQVIAGESREVIEAELRRAFAARPDLEDFIKGIQQRNARELDFVLSRRAPDFLREAASKVINDSGSKYAKTKAGLWAEVRDVFADNLGKDESRAELEARLANVIGRTNGYFQTITRTAIGALDTAARFGQALEGGYEWFEYYGPPAERSFCREHLGNVYHISEIRKLDNGQTGDAFLYRGGWNCRHGWLAVEKPEGR